MPVNSNKHLPRAVHYLGKDQDVMLVMALLAEQCGVKTKLYTQALVPSARGVLGMAGSWDG